MSALTTAVPEDLLRRMDAYWHAANYLSAGQIYLRDHPLLRKPLTIDHVVNKKAGVVRVCLPPDANCLLSVMDHCLRSKHYVNVVVAGKHPSPQGLTMDAAIAHCSKGIDIWDWASNDQPTEPDVVMACAGDVPTLETLAAVSILRKHLPTLPIRVINVADLMKLQPQSEHPHGLDDQQFDALFPKAGHFCLPRLSLADPPPDLPPDQSCQFARPGLQGRRHRHRGL